MILGPYKHDLNHFAWCNEIFWHEQVPPECCIMKNVNSPLKIRAYTGTEIQREYRAWYWTANSTEIFEHLKKKMYCPDVFRQYLGHSLSLPSSAVLRAPQLYGYTVLTAQIMNARKEVIAYITHEWELKGPDIINICCKLKYFLYKRISDLLSRW